MSYGKYFGAKAVHRQDEWDFTKSLEIPRRAKTMGSGMMGRIGMPGFVDIKGNRPRHESFIPHVPAKLKYLYRNSICKFKM